MNCSSCSTCFPCFDKYKKLEIEEIIIPKSIIGVVNRIIDCNHIVISYYPDYNTNNTNNTDTTDTKLYYNVTLNNILPYSHKRTDAIRTLIRFILNKNITLTNINNVNYNEMNADVIYEETNMNSWLVKHNYASYDQ